MKNLVFTFSVAALLSACGGGGGDAAGGGNVSTAAPVNKLAGYVGTWSTDCNDHAIDNATITSPTNNTITIAMRTDYYAAANCTGAIIATQTEGADVTATYAETVDSSIVFSQGAAATPAKVDKVTASLPQHTRSITGTGVTHVVKNGQAMWCIDYGGGSQSCIWDDGMYSAQSGVAGGLYLQNNVLYELSPSGSLYVVNEHFTKK